MTDPTGPHAPVRRRYRPRITLEYDCDAGYRHEVDGDWLVAHLNPLIPDVPEDTCLHCPDCGAEVDPGFKPCGGWGE